MIRFATVVLSALLLAGCDWFGATDQGNDARSAEGDVQKGSISDAMIPLDTVRSQAPVLKPAPGEASAGEPGDADPAATAEAAEGASEEAAETPAPAAEAPATDTED